MSKPNCVKVRQMAWYGDEELELAFPSAWEVTVCRMRGHDRPRLSDRQIRNAFSHPIGSRTIRELARGKKEVVIIFDDLTRPTPVAELVPYVLEELEEGGVADDHIRFIAGLGCHRALTRIDFVKKLGEDVVNRFPVYNHNPYENCTLVGKTSRGTAVAVNSEVMSCDLKIGIGSIVPHAAASYGGGGKLLLPGVCSIETITANHALASRAKQRGHSGSMGYGQGYEENEMRLDLAEAAKMAGLDVKVDAILNEKREVTALFVGEPVAEHMEGVKLAKEVFATDPVTGMDMVIANTYAKGTEPFHASPLASRMLKEDGGDLVLAINTPEGLITHYLGGSWGNNLGARYWQRRSRLLPRVNKLILLTQYCDRGQANRIAPLDMITWAKTWDQALEELLKDYPGKAKVAVIPDGTVQYFPE
ncbi:MAG: lactate racemase domain-containing protein [Chloroflexota bacterium]|nr:lactate racemase domain-containing protein [Chloroflexota bacterium]